MDINRLFWENPKIKELFTETKLVYLYLSTSNYKKIETKLDYLKISVVTGLSEELIKICVKQLIEHEFISSTDSLYFDVSSKAGESSSENIKASYEYTSKDKQLTIALFAVIAKTYPTYQKLASRKATEKDFAEMNKIIRIDKSTYDIIESVLRWLYTTYKPDSDFDWRDQIKSVRNLRKHFDSIRILYEKEKNKQKVTAASYSTIAPSERKSSNKAITEKEVQISPQEAEKNRVILQLIRAKKIAVTESKLYKNTSIEELTALL